MVDTAPRQPRDGMSEQTVAGRYRIVQRIARGGMADVYAAEDLAATRWVAIKVLPATQDAESIARFQREAEAAAALSHPNIVSTYEWGSFDGTHYIAMEYLPGPTLKQLIEEEGGLTEERALEIAAQLADALDFAHRRRVIHRDVKPQNVLLDVEGNAKLVDFGIARVAGSIQLTQTRSVLGTAHYLSPEQAKGGEVDARTDLYSLGAMLFEMLTGRLPFEGDNPVAVAIQHADEPPPRPRAINPAVSAEAEAVVLKAMEKDPDRRYQTAGEMRDALRAIRSRSSLILTAATTRVSPGADGKGAGTSGLNADGFGRAGGVTPPRETATRGKARRRRRAGALPLWLLPTVIGLALVALLVGMSRAGAGGVAVPDVRGLSEDEARAAVEASGLQLNVAGTLHSAEVSTGRVISQEPTAGDRLDREGIVEVAVSAGRGTLHVPDVVGRAEAEATIILRDVGFGTATMRRVPNDRVAPGVIIEQSPPAGREVPPSSSVDLVSSAGRAVIAAPTRSAVQQPVQQNQDRGGGRENERERERQERERERQERERERGRDR